MDRLGSPSLEANGLSGQTPVDVNGHGADETTVEGLQQELQRTREEKEALAGQYRNLLAKLQTMRTTLGNKLQKDAVRGAPVRSEASALTGQTGRARPARAADPAALGAE